MQTVKHIISLGAGVQSSTMALMAAHGEITPMPDCAIFADTQAEPQSVYSWLDWLEMQLPFPVYRVTAGSLSASTLDLRKTKDGRLFSKTNIPFFTKNHDGSGGKIKYRSCTADFKIRPIITQNREIVGRDALLQWRRDHREERKALAAWKRYSKITPKPLFVESQYPLTAWNTMQDNALVVQYIGISKDEATRMKPSREPWIRNRWPLIELGLSRNDCLNWMRENEYPEPPRSSCVFCPFHNDREWRRLKDEEPEEFQKAVEFEIALQDGKAKSQNFRTTPFLHKSLIALEAIDFSTLSERNGQMNFFENECEGYCGN